MQSQPRSAKITHVRVDEISPFLSPGGEEGVGENTHHFINGRNKSQVPQDARTAFKSQTHDSVGVEHPREQRRTNLDFSLGVIVDDVLYLSP